MLSETPASGALTAPEMACGGAAVRRFASVNRRTNLSRRGRTALLQPASLLRLLKSREAQRDSTPDAQPDRWLRFSGEIVAIIYIALIAAIAQRTGAYYVMFPELAALSHDVFIRPRGAWARSPVHLAFTPVLTAIAGTFFSYAYPYGYVSVSLTVAASIGIIMALKSPVAPAISAGLLPVVLGIRSWWYAPGILLGTALLALLSVGWRRLMSGASLHFSTAGETADDITELAPSGYWWLVPLAAIIISAVFLAKLTGLRFILFPPLVVIGFEMFGHPSICPWAKRPLWLPLACFLTALGGLVFEKTLRAWPAVAASSMVWGIVVLRVFDLHVPPALAVALLPLIMPSPSLAYPLSVALGTLLMTFCFLLYRQRRWRRS